MDNINYNLYILTILTFFYKSQISVFISSYLLKVYIVHCIQDPQELGTMMSGPNKYLKVFIFFFLSFFPLSNFYCFLKKIFWCSAILFHFLLFSFFLVNINWFRSLMWVLQIWFPTQVNNFPFLLSFPSYPCIYT